MAVISVTDATFEEEVLNSDKPVLVDFWAEWCGPCKMMGPVIEELSEQYPQYKFCKINVDENMGAARKYYVMSIPMFIVFKDGAAARKNVGFMPGEEVMELFQ